MKLIIGPTCSGKSSLIKEMQKSDGSLRSQFGYQLMTEEVSRSGLLHYNILHYWTLKKSVSSPSSFLDEPIFKKITLECESINEVIILVCPTDELLSRASARIKIEEHIDDEYDQVFWLNAIRGTNFYLLYKVLHEYLLDQGVCPKYVYSSSSEGFKFLSTDYVYIHHNLNGRYIPIPSVEKVDEIKKLPEFHYQEILLPHGFMTSKGHYNHFQNSRSATFNMFANEILESESLLDVGSALGELPFFAERLGCKNVVGIEIDKVRYTASLRAKEILLSNASFHNVDFHSFDSSKVFDCVACLNVIHHIYNFDDFIQKLCKMAGKFMIIEYPTLHDVKFLKAHKLVNLNFSDDLPIIGVSSKLHADQTYVFSSKAIESIVINSSDEFELVKKMDSPIPSRKLMVFKKKEVKGGFKFQVQRLSD